MISNVLSIAGSDPSGGAGVQADLKTFSALGAYGMAVMTALTAQNTQGVQGIHEVPPTFLRDQMAAVFEDIRVDAVKIGMAGSVDSVHEIAEALKTYKPAHIVLDPVMVSQGGEALLEEDARAVLKAELIPLASILTPNIPEAEMLLNQPFTGDYEYFGRALLALGPGAVYLKGGHDTGAQIQDVFCFGDKVLKLNTKRIETKNNHGTGCTLSSALAVFLAQGCPPPEVAQKAKTYITEALKCADDLDIGHGAGPVHHFYGMWNDDE